MIGTMHAAHPGAAAARVSPEALAALDADATWAHKECPAVNVRQRRPFSFSINGSYSAKANDRRRLDLVVTKSEKVTIDNWIRFRQVARMHTSRAEQLGQSHAHGC